MKNKKSLGSLGEGFAKGYLTRKGFKIIMAPFRCKSGEIDIIGKIDDTLVFIEVKTRTGNRYGSPLESITPAKQRQIIRTAEIYLAYFNKDPFKTARFDVIGITQNYGESSPEITHIEDAFRKDF